jgi:CRP/FNR family transcriptional regulator, cyclic AMP receptor protein
VTSLASVMRSTLLSLPEAGRLSSLRRSTSLYSQGQTADSLYFIEDGLVKLTRTNSVGNRIILSICGPGQLVGVEVLSNEPGTYYTEAEVLTPTTASRIPQQAILTAMSRSTELANAMVGYLLERGQVLASKVELLCLHDVEYRILNCLAELSLLVKPSLDGEGYQLPITQLELADIIGATRETTSTTLNQLERRGLVKLSRRLLTIPSPSTLRDAATARLAMEEQAVGAPAKAAP